MGKTYFKNSNVSWQMYCASIQRYEVFLIYMTCYLRLGFAALARPDLITYIVTSQWCLSNTSPLLLSFVLSVTLKRALCAQSVYTPRSFHGWSGGRTTSSVFFAPFIGGFTQQLCSTWIDFTGLRLLIPSTRVWTTINRLCISESPFISVVCFRFFFTASGVINPPDVQQWLSRINRPT